MLSKLRPITLYCIIRAVSEGIRMKLLTNRDRLQTMIIAIPVPNISPMELWG